MNGLDGLDGLAAEREGERVKRAVRLAQKNVARKGYGKGRKLVECMACGEWRPASMAVCPLCADEEWENE